MNFKNLISSMLYAGVSFARGCQANLNYYHEGRIKRNGDKLRVGFMCQYIPAWGKMEPVYRAMKADSRFEVFLLCVPIGIQNNRLINPEDTANDTYEYYVNHGCEAVNTLIGRSKWLDLESLNLDYIFFSRPYNHYMPKQYSSRKLSRYTKICVLLYAYTLLEETYSSTLNKDFFRNVYLYFAENKFSMRKNINHFKLRHRLGIQKSVFRGMPGLENILKAKGAPSPAWEFSDNVFRVIWTPRWTTDKSMGGSNFFVYKDSMLDYADGHRDMDFLFRPHPLAFDNFLKTGEMSREEVEAYKDRVNQTQNVSLDTEKEYAATMWSSSVLVSDISSVISEYFITGKPIIYCASNVEVELGEWAKTLIDGCYAVYNEKELFDKLEQLRNGEDILHDKRQSLIRTVFGEHVEASSNLVIEELVKDSRLNRTE